jgi:signal transduction histidine kinase
MSRIGQPPTLPDGFVQKTIVLYGDETTPVIMNVFANAKSRWDTCADKMGPTINMGVAAIREATYGMFHRGVKLRYLTEITKENLVYCKELMRIAEVRHLDGIRGGMAVGDTEYLAAATLIEKEPVPHLIYSNVREIVAQQQYVFQALWATAKPAEERLAEIEEGKEPEYFESIRDRNEARDIFQSMIIAAEEEILLQLPSSRTLLQLQKLGLVDKLVEKSNNQSLAIKVICPVDSENEETVEALCERATGVSLRAGEDSTNTLLVVDSEKVFRAELVNSQDEDFEDSIGLTVYSNRAQSVSAFRSFFETHWKELSLIERLKEHDQEKDEFISIAAHELRNPITPILFVIEGLKEELGEREEITRLFRNTKRLQMVVQNILESTRIDNHNLVLNKTAFDMAAVIKEAIEDAKLQAGEKKLQIAYQDMLLENPLVVITADKMRISQVIHNLLQNAAKFTPAGGRIDVTIQKIGRSISIQVRDYGPGIHPDVLPRLFHKFATRSEQGTGLGLFLCKAIIEAHGGKIGGENNSDGKGATFQFTLPIENKSGF